jgi:hypothetical protein
VTSFLERVDEVFSKDKPTLAVVPNPAAAGANPSYVQAAVAAELERVRTAADGTRNDTLNAAAFNLGQFIGAGHLEYFATFDALHAAAMTAGLDVREADKTIRSGFGAGEQQPRAVPSTTVAADSLAAMAPLTTPRPPAAAGLTTTTSPAPSSEVTPRRRRRRTAPSVPRPRRRSPPLLRRQGQRAPRRERKRQDVDRAARRPPSHPGRRAGAHPRLRRQRPRRPRPPARHGRHRQHLQHLAYVAPEETLHAAANADLSATLTQLQPALILVDGVNAAMTLLGLDLESNTDAPPSRSSSSAPSPPPAPPSSPSTTSPKNKEQRGKGGIGAQAKRAMVTGCAITVEVLAEFGRGMTGKLHLTVDKDRPGRVRAVSAGARTAGTVRPRDGGRRLLVDRPPPTSPLRGGGRSRGR